MTPQLSKRLLQIAIAIGGVVPVAAGAAGMVLGAQMLGESAALPLDNHLRYLSGILFAIGLCFWSFIPTIERKTTQVRLLTLLVFIGGLARLGGVIWAGTADASMLFALTMELIITPSLCLWQGRVAKHHLP